MEAIRHSAFQSKYRQGFEVVEECHGRLRLYPHTEQLPRLLRALNLEFYAALPARIARVDHRADGFHKIVLKSAALMYTTYINDSRSDQLRLFPVLDRQLVSRVAIVQQITEMDRRGPCHRFRFYAGADFFSEFYLSGKRVAFADHVLQRFSARVPNRLGDDLMALLLTFFGAPMVSMSVGPGRAFVLPYLESIIAFTYKESATEFFITTCLSINEMNSLRPEIPPRAYNVHYDAGFAKPKIRNWVPICMMSDNYDRWTRKIPVPEPKPATKKANWHRIASLAKDVMTEKGHGPGSRLCFIDNIPGPCAVEVLPHQQELQYNELEVFKKQSPEQDWDAIFAEREVEIC